MLWVGSENTGLNILDFRQEQFVNYGHRPADPNSLSPGRVKAIHHDASGVLWVGFFPRVLDRLDRATSEIKHYLPHPGDGNALGAGTNVDSIYRDGAGYPWIGGGGAGLDRLDERTGHFKHYRHKANDPNSLISDNVYTIYEDRKGPMWVGGQYGLSRFVPEKDQFENYRPDTNNSGSLLNWVWVIYEDRAGSLWLRTFGGELIRFDDLEDLFPSHAKRRRNHHYPRRQEWNFVGGSIRWTLPVQPGSRSVRPLHGTARTPEQHHPLHSGESKRQTLAQYTKGHIPVDPRTDSFRSYDASDGLQSNDFSDGQMFFGGSDGFNAFFPKSITDDPYVPPILTSGLSQ